MSQSLEILALTVTALVAALGQARAAEETPGKTAPADRPNIILCMTDDQGWGDVSYNGLKKIKTPNLDNMAAAGLRFDRFYAQQSCSPTRACVVTGRHPNRMGVFWPGIPLRRQEMTIAQAAKTAGYTTGHFGKWHLNGVAGPGKPITATDPLGPGPFGFDEWFSVSNYFETDWTFSRNGKNVKTTGDGSDAIVGEALKFIGDCAAKKEPFLALVWFGSPHSPYNPLPADLQAAGGSGYFGEMLGVDRSMGTLRSGLRKLGIADNTLVVFSSDNGGWVEPDAPDARGTNAGLRGRKGDMWEGGIRVPGIMEWPARIKPAVTSVPAGLVDLYPTIVELTGAQVPHQIQPLDGISLVPLLDGMMKERPKPMGFWQYDETQPTFTADSGFAAWMDNRFKLHKVAPGKWELHDIPADLAETTDVAAKHPEVVARMKAELDAWQQSVVRSHRGEDYPGKRVMKLVTLQSLLGEMIDREALAQLPDPAYTLKQASSFDRAQADPANLTTWFANKDYEQFIRVEQNEGRREWVIMEHQGPGCVVRFWLPLHGPKKNQMIRFYFDGAKTPAIAVKFNDLLSGRSFVKPPLAFVASDEKAAEGVGGDLYLPIPFASGCKITLDELPFYYIVNYRAYEPGAMVSTFTMADYEGAAGALARNTRVLNEMGNVERGKKLDKQGTIEPGAELTLDLPGGAHAVRTLQVELDPRDAPQVLRTAVLTATFDGQPTVWCPVGEFFGCGTRLNPVKDWSRSVEKDGTLKARWVMPYRESGSVTIKNHGTRAIAVKLAASANRWAWDDRSMYFHANWRHECPIRTKRANGTLDWNYLETRGQGVYVGDTLTVFNPVAAWYGEGDERVYVDGEKMPSHLGTGTEDYYGYAWGMARQFDSPFISMPKRDRAGRDDWRGYTTTSRVRLLDGIPWRRSLKVDMEIWHWAATTMDYAVGTFWYARPDASSNRGPAPDEAARELLK